jgi:hypothetical protein
MSRSCVGTREAGGMTDLAPGDIAITTRQVMRECWPILLVTHDADDGAWQFVNGRGDTDTDSAMVVKATRIAELDPAVAELADLPLGWRAWREASDKPWKREAR